VSKHTQKNLYENLPDKNKILVLAGCFDGEGSFGLWNKVKKKRYFGVSLEASDRDMVKRFHIMFGGSFYPLKRRKEHYKDTWRWKIWGRGAFCCIDKMIPYMCLRRQEKYNVVQRTIDGNEGRVAHL
tara:strand:- start:51 stop:431 length:381 start_codon:yes stop_codon:yes gene_type:complete